MARLRSAIDTIELMRSILAFLLIGAFIGAMGAFTMLAIPDTNKDILTYMVGQLSGMATTVLGFFFINKVGQDAIDAKRSDNTGKLTDLAHEALKLGKPAGDQVADAVDETVSAAENKATEIKENGNA
jgi:hypothetical protein